MTVTHLLVQLFMKMGTHVAFTVAVQYFVVRLFSAYEYIDTRGGDVDDILRVSVHIY